VDLGIFLNQVIWGVLVGVSYSLLAIAFSLIFSAANTINFANGEYAMLGAYFCYTVLSKLHNNILSGAIVALILCFAFGALVERVAFRRLYRLDPVLIVIATIGVSTMLKNLVLIIWGSYSKSFPISIQMDPIHVGSLVIVPQNIILLVIGCFVMLVFHLFMTRTKLGTAMRATAQNPKAASLVGINTRRTINLTWGLGSVVAGIGGILIAFIALNTIMIALEFFYVPLVPAVLLFLALALVSVDKYLLAIVFFVPLSIPLSVLTDGLSIDMYLPTEPLLAGLLLLYAIKYMLGDRIDLRILRHPVSVAIYFHLAWMFMKAKPLKA